MAEEIQFATHEINSIKDLLEFYEDHHEIKWVYRGQAEAKWRLKTSLDRTFEHYEINQKQDKIKAEKNLIREFKRRYHQYSRYVPDINNDLEWLSLMQHYGAPTRLLDFTYSLYVGVYFALEEAYYKDISYCQDDENHDCDSDDIKYCALWAINSEWAKDETISKLKKEKDYEDLIELFEMFLRNDPKLLQKEYLQQEVLVELFEMFLRNDSKLLQKRWLQQKLLHPFDAFRKVVLENKKTYFVCTVNPIILNERLTAQKGVFMCPSIISESFEYNLSQLCKYNSEKNIIKIKIPKKKRHILLRNLYEMNISRTTLFPDLEGFAKTLMIYHPMAHMDIIHL